MARELVVTGSATCAEPGCGNEAPGRRGLGRYCAEHKAAAAERLADARRSSGMYEVLGDRARAARRDPGVYVERAKGLTAIAKRVDRAAVAKRAADATLEAELYRWRNALRACLAAEGIAV